MASPFASMHALFAVPDYRRLWLIGAAAGTARWLEFLALSIYTYQITGSAPLVALIAIVRMLPYALLGFLVGAAADFMDRKWLLTLGAVLALTAALTMAILTIAGLSGYWTVLLLAAVSGLVWTTDMPIRRRLLVEAVGGDRMAAALGFDNSTSHATRALGPFIGGIAYQTIGIAGIFCMTALLYAACLFWSLRLAGRNAGKSGVLPLPSLATLLVPPWELLRDRRFQIVLGVTAVYNLWCFPFLTMVSVIAQRDFTLAPAAVGALAACDGIGGTLGALVVGWLGSQRSLFRIYYFGTVAFLVSTLTLSWYLTVGAAIPLLLCLGAAAACFSATQFGLVYSMADPTMRGRAAGFLSIFIGLSTVGHYMTGLLFDKFGSAEAARLIAMQGLAAIFVLGVLWLRARRAPDRVVVSERPSRS